MTVVLTGCFTKAKPLQDSSSDKPLIQTPDTLKVSGKIYMAPNPAPKLPYIPSQNLTPFPNRLRDGDRYWGAAGIGELAPDTQKPLPDGAEFLLGAAGYCEINNRRAGVRCLTKPIFSFRMELFYPLATAAVGIKENGKIFWLDEFTVNHCQVHPGRVHYDLESADLKIKIELDAVAPEAIPAYGMIAKIVLHNGGSEQRNLELLAVAESKSLSARTVKNVPSPDQTFLTIPCPQEPLPGRTPYLTDINYSLFIGWDGRVQGVSAEGLAKAIQLAPGGWADSYLTGVIDSPGYDEKEIPERIRKFFDRNPNLPAAERQRMTQEAIETFAGIVSDGDKTFLKIYQNPQEAFEKCLTNWRTGVYRDTVVNFTLPDKKLQALANLTANDLFPTLIQPPGIVHDSKFGDPWHLIFCYEHVHAASDFGLEKNALDYMRLLSTNQKDNGWIRSCDVDFQSDAHPTSFDASYIDALYHYYKWTGDLESVKQLWPTLVRALHFIDISLDPDDDALYRDIIHEWKSDADSRGPSSCFETALVRKAYADMAEFAGLLGQPWHQERYTSRAKRIMAAAQKELWSDEMAMLGSKCPLGMLRLHPECLEVQIPIWTGLVDPWQGFVLTDWFLHNVSFRDAQGGLWVKESDWWPMMWSQALIADGDSAMIAWALLQTGNFDQGCKILETLAGSGFRSTSPGMSYIVNNQGAYFHDNLGGKNPATDIGSLGRALIEGVFGVEPHLDQKRFVIRPRFAWGWDAAEFSRKGLGIKWNRSDTGQSMEISTAADVTGSLELPVRSEINTVRVNGKPADYKVVPAVKHAKIVIDLPAGGATVEVRTQKPDWKIESQPELKVGQTAKITLADIDAVEIDDRFAFFEIIKNNRGEITVKLKKAACGRATLFLNCTKGNIEWIEPVVFTTIPQKAADIQPRTVSAPLPEHAKVTLVDLSPLYNQDVQKCFEHRWDWDHGRIWPHESAEPGKRILYWFQPIFKLTKPLPGTIEVTGVPFRLGPMGPGDAEKENDLLMIADNPPYELPTGFEVNIDKPLQKIYLLSLNMTLSQKCYVPAVDIVVHYTDGTQSRTQLVPPLNFDSYEQDFGINTAAFPLKDITWEPQYINSQHHLTMTDVLCNPRKTVRKIEFRSIATESFFALAGMTLVAAEQGR